VEKKGERAEKPREQPKYSKTAGLADVFAV
jgi:hypothetical protein